MGYFPAFFSQHCQLGENTKKRRRMIMRMMRMVRMRRRMMRMTMTRERRGKMRKRMMHCSLTQLRGEERFCCNDGETSLPLEKVSHHNFAS